MRILMLVDSYYPRTIGGIELYVHALSHELRASGHEVHWACASWGGECKDELVDGIPLHQFAFPKDLTNEEYRLEVRPRRFEEFEGWLRQLAPDVVHSHMQALHVLMPVMESANAAGIRTITTVHTAAFTCRRRSVRRAATPMLHFGTSQCDGELRPLRCTACVLQGRGLPTPLAMAATAVEAVAVHVAPNALARIGEVAAMPLVLAKGRSAIARLGRAVQHFAVIAEWQRRALVATGLAQEKVTTVRHGVSGGSPRISQSGRESVVFGWAGRAAPEKGLRELVRAFEAVRDERASLLIACVASDPSERAYRDEIVEFTAGDDRVKWIPPFTPGDQEGFYSGVDVLVAPYAVETGPLTVVEALARGIPVIGSDLGGIRELVKDGETGRLVPYRDHHALVAALRHALDDHARARWSRNAMWKRSVADVASDYHHLYAGTRSADTSVEASTPVAAATG